MRKLSVILAAFVSVIILYTVTPPPFPPSPGSHFAVAPGTLYTQGNLRAVVNERGTLVVLP